MAHKRILAATILAGALLVGTTGCSFVSPIASQNAYQPADGININLGDVKVRNLRVYQVRTDKKGFIIGSFLNTGNNKEGATLTFTDADGTRRRVRIDIPANQKVDVGYNGGLPVAESMDVLPGQRAHITVSSDDFKWKAALVPVLELPTA